MDDVRQELEQASQEEIIEAMVELVETLERTIRLCVLLEDKVGKLESTVTSQRGRISELERRSSTLFHRFSVM